MSILSTLPLHLLCNSSALEHILHHFGKKPEWELWSYASFLKHDSLRPGHVFERRWRKFAQEGGCHPDQEINLIKALNCIGEGYLELRHGRLYVKNDSEINDEPTLLSPATPEAHHTSTFGRWQNIRARVSTLPIKLWMLHRSDRPMEFFLAHPYSSHMHEFINTDGLNETHLHINGYQYPEESWLDDLFNIDSFLERELPDFKQPATKRLYASINPRLTPNILANRLKIAQLLRDTIIRLLDESGTEEDAIERIRNTNLHLRHYALSPYFFTLGDSYSYPSRTLSQRLREEMEMWHRTFIKLESPDFRHKTAIGHFLHLYLLIENEYLQLNRHNEHRKGFDAFAEFSDHRRRSVGTKQYYKETFLRILKASRAHAGNSIEVRLTPSALLRKKKLIIDAYQTACRCLSYERAQIARQRGYDTATSASFPELILVAHFIKKELQAHCSPAAHILTPLYGRERALYLKEAAELARGITRIIGNRRIPVGIDAANSELKLPPEVFAPAFRLFERRTAICHKTYHCGEDFLHLLNGIRAVYEAVTFLHMRKGNRIGHGTALGILPAIWLESMPARLLMPRREWFLNLIFAWKLLYNNDNETAAVLEKEALRMADLIFGEEETTHHSIHVLESLFHARQFDPRDVNRYRNGHLPLTRQQQTANEDIERFSKQHGQTALKLYWSWSTDPDCRARQEEAEEVPTDFLSAPILLTLQQKVQHLLSGRDIVIETLPVSNLRISQYKDIQQHHILRWLKAGKYAQPMDADLLICVGSDDPGIFVSDIKNEYYHLYTMLRTAGLTATEAIEKLRHVNKVGRTYSFRDIPATMTDMSTPCPLPGKAPRTASYFNNTKMPFNCRA